MLKKYRKLIYKLGNNLYRKKMRNPPKELSFFSSIQNELNTIQTPRIPEYWISSNKNKSENDILAQDNIEHVKDITNGLISIIPTKPLTNSISEDSLPEIKVTNIVNLFDVGCNLDLQEIALKCPNSEYNPKRLNAVIMRIKMPKTVSLIFSTGKCICTGAKNEVDSKTASRIYAKILKKIGYTEAKFKNFEIINIVSTCDLKVSLNLAKLNAEMAYIFNKSSNKDNDKIRVNYEPEQFPGIIYRMINPRITLLVFASGKVNFVGVKERNEAFEAIKKVYHLLLKHKSDIIKNENGTNENRTYNNIIDDKK